MTEKLLKGAWAAFITFTLVGFVATLVSCSKREEPKSQGTIIPDVPANVLPNFISKFRDGNNVCYIANTQSSGIVGISCVRD